MQSLWLEQTRRANPASTIAWLVSAPDHWMVPSPVVAARPSIERTSAIGPNASTPAIAAAREATVMNFVGLTRASFAHDIGGQPWVAAVDAAVQRGARRALGAAGHSEPAH